MKLSGHSFNNSVFNSLLNGLSKDIELKKGAETIPHPKVDGTEVFSSNTINNFKDVQLDQLQFVANELAFAADKAKIEIDESDLAKFASQIQNEGLRGKDLERAASKYCNDLDRAIRSPQGHTTLSANELIDKLASHKIVPAGYDPNKGSNNSQTGSYMGSIRNPNTIWDTDAMHRYASKQDDGAKSPFGDERIQKSAQEQAEYKTSMTDNTPTKEEYDQQTEVAKMQAKVVSSASTEVSASNPPIPTNAMSMFDNQRDFENIPDSTVGEEIVAKAEARANKKNSAQKEEKDIQRPMNTKDSLNRLF